LRGATGRDDFVHERRHHAEASPGYARLFGNTCTNMIYLLGGSGAPNFGDELMLQHWLKLTAPTGATSTARHVVVDNNSESVSQDLFGTRFPHARFVAVLKKLRHPGRSTDLMDNVEFGATFFSSGAYRHHPEVMAILPLLERSEVLHIYGGGYINAAAGAKGGLLLGLAADARRMFGMRLVATGLGLSPLTVEKGRSTGALEESIAAFDLFETRDHYGFQQVKRIAGSLPGLICGHDDSFALPLRRNPKRTGHRKLHLSSTKGSGELLRPSVLRLIRRNLGRFDELVYWACAPHVEGAVIERLQQEFAQMRVAPVEELLFDGLPVDPEDYMLTVRFHPHMVASRLGCSGQFFSEGTYYDHKHASVIQLGSRFERHDPLIRDFESAEQPIAWRESAHVALKRLIVERIYRPSRPIGAAPRTAAPVLLPA
jgi:hypothetical protein